MTVTQAVLDFLEDCPYMADLLPVRTDYIGSKKDNSGLLHRGRTVVQRYFDGGVLWKEKFLLYARFDTAQETKRQEIREKMEAIADWLEEKSHSGVLPNLGTGRSAQAIEVEEGEIDERQPNLVYAVYQFGFSLLWRKQRDGQLFVGADSRIFYINIGNKQQEKYVPLSTGIWSRTNSISEKNQTYYVYDENGSSFQVPQSQMIGVRMKGHRVSGDAAQEKLWNAYYGLQNREIEFVDFDTTASEGEPNAWKGTAQMIMEQPSEETAGEEMNLVLQFQFHETPQRGTAVFAEDGTCTFTPSEEGE